MLCAEHGAILGFETKPLVSTDYVNDTRSTIVDAVGSSLPLCDYRCDYYVITVRFLIATALPSPCAYR